MRTEEPRPFEDSPELDSASNAEWTTNVKVPPFISLGMLGVAAAALLSAMWFYVKPAGLIESVVSRSDIGIYLHGSPVAKLHDGASVMLGSLVVGEVVAVEEIDGTAVAEIRLDAAYADRIPRTSRFEVCSLNEYAPGNVGVRVSGPSDAPVGNSIENGSHVQVVESPLPPEIPVRFYLVAGLGFCALVVLLGLAKLFKSELTLLAGVLLLIVAALYLWGPTAVP